MGVEQLSKQKDPKNVSSYDIICIILMAGVQRLSFPHQYLPPNCIEQ